MKLFKTLALVGYGHSHFAKLDPLTPFDPSENNLVKSDLLEPLDRSKRYPRRRGPPGTAVQNRPSSQIDDPRGAPGVAQARKWVKSDKEKIIRDYVRAARIPFTWDFNKQVDFISKQINVPSNDLDNEFIIAVERATFNVPILSDVPAPPALGAESLRPSWYPPVNFGQDRGPPGVFTEQNSGHLIEEKNKKMFGEYHGGSALYPGEIRGAPGEKTQRAEKFDIEAWMQTYGYLPERKSNDGKPETKSQMSAGDMKNLIKDIQYQYGLTESGILDSKTMSAIRKPRCSKPDTPRSSSKSVKESNPSGYHFRSGPRGYKINPGEHKWPNPAQNKPVTWSIMGYSPDMPPELTEKTFRDSFRVWEKVADIRFEQLTDYTEDADIIIYFGEYSHGDAWPFNGQNGLLAHAFYPDPVYGELMGDMHFDESELWTWGHGTIVRAVSGTTDKKRKDNYCNFPFWYDGIEYKDCASVPAPNGNSDYKWCSTTNRWEGKWGFCGDPKLYTYGGNANGEQCHFPFTFLGKQYDKCTADGRDDGYMWCSPDADFDQDKRYGFCPRESGATSGGNGGGEPCAFPFVFLGNTYNSCTTQGRTDNLLWCATTSDYDQDKKYGFCKGYEYSLFHVAAHEAGHAIGLDHSNMESALMYPSYHLENDWSPDYNRGLDELYQLPYDDTSAAQYLYGPARYRPTQPTTRPTTRQTTRRTTRRPTTDSPTQNCQWSNWSSYSTCSVTCGNGSKSRTRICENVSRRRISCDRQCSGSDEEKHYCNIVACNSPTEPPTETVPTLSPIATYGVSATTSYENPTAGDDDECITQTTFHTALCSQPYDSIFQYSRETFVFRDDKMWRIEGENHYSPAFVSSWKLKGPLDVRSYWADLPSRIDAVYRVPELPGITWANGNTRFFSGSQYWEFNGFRILPGYPKSITELGLPIKLRFNAAVNRRMGKRDNYRRFTHLFAGNRFYVMDEKLNRLVGQRHGYDVRQAPIIGLPLHDRIIGAMEGSDDGHTYFFTSSYYYRVDDKEDRVNYVGVTTDDFLHCCKVEENPKIQTIRGSGVCSRSINFHDYRCDLGNNIINQKSIPAMMSQTGPSSMMSSKMVSSKSCEKSDNCPGYPREYLRRRRNKS